MIDICECDVKDKEKLAIFRLKRSEWVQCLIEDTFSISNQISNILWNDTVFRTINEARKLTANRDLKTFGFNGPLLELFDQGYATAQVMAIRRITDPTFHDPSRTVISLPRLIDDMRQNADLITRENYICYDGASFEVDTHEKQGIDWMHWKSRHEIFDRLSKVSLDKRQRTDKISENVFKSLARELKICEGLRTYANRFIAHASDTRNRVNLTEKQRNVTLQKLNESYKAIIRVASFIGALILYQHSLSDVLVPQFNQLENLDKPMVSHEDLRDLSAYWHHRTKDIGSWKNDLWSILRSQHRTEQV